MNYNTGTKPFTNHDNYRDLDGNMRTFTVVDHDKKTKVNTTFGIDTQQVQDWLKEARVKTQDKILSMPAVLCSKDDQKFVLRGEQGIRWNEVAIRDEGVSLDILRDILTVLENRADLVSQGINP